MAAGRLGGKVAIVTGAAKGQGEGAARRFAAEGAKVALLDVLDPLGKSVAEEIAASGGEALSLHCDVSRESDVARAVERTVAHFGGLDVLYNNAAILRFGRKIADLDVEEWELGRIPVGQRRRPARGRRDRRALAGARRQRCDGPYGRGSRTSA